MIRGLSVGTIRLLTRPGVLALAVLSFSSVFENYLNVRLFHRIFTAVATVR